MASRLELDRHGRLVAVQVTPDHPVVPPGARRHVLGNSLEPAGLGIGFLGAPTGRPSGVTPTAKREPDVEMRCEDCGTRYTIAARNARRGARPLCRLCRGIPEPPEPTEEMFTYWTSRYEPAELHQLAGAFAA